MGVGSNNSTVDFKERRPRAISINFARDIDYSSRRFY